MCQFVLDTIAVGRSWEDCREISFVAHICPKSLSFDICRLSLSVIYASIYIHIDYICRLYLLCIPVAYVASLRP